MHAGEFSAERGASGGLSNGAGGGESGQRPQEFAKSPHGCADANVALLLRTIEGEIVPRLVLARRSPRTAAASDAPGLAGPDRTDVQRLVQLLLAHDVAAASCHVEAIRQRGASFEVVCLSLLTPAARELGRLWETDECNFMQVTVGLCSLHQLLREISAGFRLESVEPRVERNILLAPLPGDQHTFGITLVAQFLRQAGWQVWSEISGSLDELLAVVRSHWFTAIGLSLGSETRMDELARVIQELRRASCNPSVGILAGGPLLVVKPELAALTGADATATDGPMAVLRAEELFAHPPGNHRGAGGEEPFVDE